MPFLLYFPNTATPLYGKLSRRGLRPLPFNRLSCDRLPFFVGQNDVFFFIGRKGVESVFEKTNVQCGGGRDVRASTGGRNWNVFLMHSRDKLSCYDNISNVPRRRTMRDAFYDLISTQDVVCSIRVGPFSRPHG